MGHSVDAFSNKKQSVPRTQTIKQLQKACETYNKSVPK